MNNLYIKKIEQTNFFMGKDVLKNLVKLTIVNKYRPIRCLLKILCGSRIYEEKLGLIEIGENIYHVYIPDIRENVKLKFVICDELGNTLAEKIFDWKPKRHWLIFLVQYSHHDLGYTDLPQNVLEEYVGFYDAIIRFYGETEKWPKEVRYKYQVQPWSLYHYLRTQPHDKVKDIIELLKNSGIGVSALQGNVVSGLCGHEEIIRLLYPSISLRKMYGVDIDVAEINDVPGLSWALATILPGCGVKVIAPLLPRLYYRPEQTPFWDEEIVTPRKIPTAFWWESLNGDRILFWYQGMEFGDNLGFTESYEKVLKNLPKLLDELEDKGYPFNAVLLRLRGGRDNSPPMLKPCMIAREWNEKWTYPKIIISTLSEFFKHIEDKHSNILERLPVFRGELPDSDYPVGATSTAQATAINRNAHDLILSAEKFATIADHIVGLDYPYKKYIDEAYEHTILYDEHTWGLCCPFGPAHECSRIEKILHAYKAYALAHDVLIKALNRIADNIDLRRRGYYIIVFNPLPWSRTDVVEVWLKDPDPCGHPVFTIEKNGMILQSFGSVLGRNIFYPPLKLFEKPFKIIEYGVGKTVIHQMVTVNDAELPLPFAGDRVGLASIDERYVKKLLFLAEDIPPLGYKVYEIVFEETMVSEKLEKKCLKDSCIIENEYYRVVVNPSNGTISSIFDKELGKELVDPNAPHRFGQIVVREASTGKEYYMRNVRIEKVLRGRLLQSVVVKGGVKGHPLAILTINLYKGVKRIDIAYKFLKDMTPILETYIAFPFNISNPHFKYEGPNIVVTPLRDQFPGSHTCYYPVQHWVNIYSDEGYGVTWSSIDAHLVEFGDLWPVGVSWAHHCVTPHGYPHRDLRVKRFEKAYIYSFILNNNFRTNFYVTQVGELLFRYSITSHKGDWRTNVSRNHGWSVANPLIPVFINKGKIGKLPPTSHSFCEIDKPNIMITTLKQSEDSEGIILRLIETSGEDTKVTVKLPFINIKKAYITNLIEEEIDSIKVVDNKVTINVKAFEIVTLKLI